MYWISKLLIRFKPLSWLGNLLLVRPLPHHVPAALLLLVTQLLCFAAQAGEPRTNDSNWQQAGGPNFNWQVTSSKPAPINWSVSRDENVRWRSELPNAGQSGIAVWGDHLFLTTFAQGEGHGTGKRAQFSSKVIGICVDAKAGAKLWQVALDAAAPSPMMYAYSDSTSPTPVTNGEVVVFTNASGAMAAFDFAGNELWRRTWTPWSDDDGYPFNKQHEPILIGGEIVNLEPLDGNPKEKPGWNYLRGIDIRTGETNWIAENGTTSYVTSVLGMTAEGMPAVMTGRGAVHGHPERPAGMELMSLAAGEKGKPKWMFLTDTDAQGNKVDTPGVVTGPTWPAMYNAHWDEKYAYWFNLNPVESSVLLDIHTGKLVKKQSLIHNVDYRRWNPHARSHELLAGVDLRELHDWSPRVKAVHADRVITVFPAWHSNIVVVGYHYFLCSTAHTRNGVLRKTALAGPSHCLGRVNIETGKVEYFELPVTVIRKAKQPDEFVYGVQVRTETINSQGVDVAAEDRSRRDGWQIPAFWGSPTAINGNIYYTTMLGVTYVIRGDAQVLDESALLAVNDLGPSGKTWSLNSISFSNGTIYHRTAKELIAIAQKEKKANAP